MSKLFDVAEEIKTGLQKDFQIECAVDAAPEIGFAQLKKARMYVVPASYQIDKSTRKKSLITGRFTVLYCLKCDMKDIPVHFEIMEKIAKWFENRIFEKTAAAVLKVSVDPIYDASLQKENKIFVSVCTVDTLFFND